MTDLREKQPSVRAIPAMPGANYEVEIAAWTYFSIKSEDVISPKLIYHIHADNFREATSIATILRDTVQSMHDIHVAKVVRIQEWRAH